MTLHDPYFNRASFSYYFDAIIRNIWQDSDFILYENPGFIKRRIFSPFFVTKKCLSIDPDLLAKDEGRDLSNIFVKACTFL